MFEHSVKVPRHYKIAANIFKKVYTEGGSVKTLLYDDKLRHFRTNVLYALITETIKHAVDIDKIFESSQIFVKEPRLDPWLAKVLAVELLYGKKTLPGKSKPEQTILSYKEQFEKSIPEQQDDLKSKVVRRPRYVRINTNLLATSDAIRAFQDEGYKFIRCTSGSYNDYLQQIQTLTEYDFTQDYHVKTVFVFSPGTKLHEHDLYMENQIILQDKATALAVHLLAPPLGSVCLDMCAAPGMKTTQLAAYIRNQGKIYAVERNENRYKTLCDFVARTGSKCVETLHKDSLEIKKGDYDDVEYILLDPSCSGSGMDLQVHNYIEDTRLARLTSLQEKFLKHAMNSFPNAKRIVYSTCSLFPEENERVITNIVKASRAKWRVQDVKELLKGQWNNFGSGMYGSIGTRCLYAKPDTDFTTGFFLAVLDRDPKDFEKNQGNDLNIDTEVGNNNDTIVTDDNNTKEFEIDKNEVDLKSNRKIKKKQQLKTDDKKGGEQVNLKEEIEQNHENARFVCNDVLNTEEIDTSFKIEKSKHKRKKKNGDIIDLRNDVDDINSKTKIVTEIESNENEATKKKKKRKIKLESPDLARDEDNVEIKRYTEEITYDTEVKKKKKKNSKVESCTNLELDGKEFKEINNEATSENRNDSNDRNVLHNEETKRKKRKKSKVESLSDIAKTEDMKDIKEIEGENSKNGGEYTETKKKSKNKSKVESLSNVPITEDCKKLRK